MATSSKIKIMISSRCNDEFPPGEGTSLSEIRRQLKAEIEAVKVFGGKAFEVWINEEAPPKAASWDSWEVCMEAVRDCDILLVISNGHAGWAKAHGEIGICHAELMTALSVAPGKVWYISLGNVASGDEDQATSNARFQKYAQSQNLFRGAEVKTVPELKARVHEALHEAIITLTQRGVRESSQGKFYTGEALDWSRLDFAGRQREMIRVTRDALKERPGAIDIDPAVSLPIAGASLFFMPTAIPAAITIASAREMVGQPFLRDYEMHKELRTTKATGPVHLIACNKGVTEAQALRVLGFPDATVVVAPFGIYVADDIQKIQMIFIANCRDEATTRHGVQRALEWLEQTGENARLALRAASRTKIIETIANESAPKGPGSPLSTKLSQKRRRR